VRFWVLADPPGVTALIAIVEVPVGVLTEVLMLTATAMGFPFVGATDADG
jgi:hypothetical protein